MKKTVEEIKKLEEYLSLNPRNKIELTYKLGYCSTFVITKWLQRGNIPRWALADVMKIIEGAK